MGQACDVAVAPDPFTAFAIGFITARQAFSGRCSGHEAMPCTACPPNRARNRSSSSFSPPSGTRLAPSRSVPIGDWPDSSLACKATHTTGAGRWSAARRKPSSPGRRVVASTGPAACCRPSRRRVSCPSACFNRHHTPRMLACSCSSRFRNRRNSCWKAVSSSVVSLLSAGSSSSSAKPDRGTCHACGSGQRPRAWSSARTQSGPRRRARSARGKRRHSPTVATPICDKACTLRIGQPRCRSPTPVSIGRNCA